MNRWKNGWVEGMIEGWAEGMMMEERTNGMIDG